MSSNYPTSLDDGTSLPSVSGNTVTNVVSHAGLHDNTTAATIAIESKLGINASTPPGASETLVSSSSGQSAWGVLPIAGGGTNATSASGARTSLGVAASGANGDITSLTGLTTPLPMSEGGTGNTSGNAASVNSIQASATATANKLYPLNASTVFPTTVIQSSVLGYAQVTSTATTTNTSDTLVTGLSITVTTPTLVGNQRIEVEAYARDMFVTGGGIMDVKIYMDGAAIMGIEPNTTSGTAIPLAIKSSTTPTAASHTFAIYFSHTGGTQANIEAASAYPFWMQVKVV